MKKDGERTALIGSSGPRSINTKKIEMLMVMFQREFLREKLGMN